MQTASVVLLTNAAATSGARQWPGGRGLFMVVATFGGGSVALEYRGPDNTTWLAAPAVSLTANGGVVFELPPCEVRAVVTTATAVYATVARIPS